MSLMIKIAIFVNFSWWLASCSPQGGGDAALTNIPPKSPQESQAQDDKKEAASGPKYQTRPKVSAFSLDDNRFSIVGVAVGLQSFMSSETPLISYKLPEQADYVEIIRCRTDVILTAGTEAISIVDLELSGMSEADKAQFYRSSNIFRVAEEQKGCELISDGVAEMTFHDSFAPSGSYRYFVRACVNPKRLIDTDKLTARNCSRRVAVSSVLADFTNARREKEIEHLRQASVYSSAMDQAANTMRVLAEDANQAINECETREHKRLVDVKIRNAWITVAAIAIEIVQELKTAQIVNRRKAGAVTAYARHYTNPKNFMDIVQIIGATQGYMLADTFIMLAASSSDMPRSCTRYKRLIDEYQIAENVLADAAYKHGYHMEFATLAQAGQLGADGEPTGIQEAPASQQP